jgi:hypothetical protein
VLGIQGEPLLEHVDTTDEVRSQPPAS